MSRESTASSPPSPTPSAAGLVCLVDDDTSFLVAMSRLLRASGYVVKTFSSPHALLADVPRDVDGCILMDLDMPGMDGLALQEALLATGQPTMPIVFLSGHGDVPSTARAMRRGAEDFLTKRAPKAEVLAAIERALERCRRERVRHQHVRELRARLEQLTSRERQVLALVVEGKLNKQIADALGIHERTVKLHRTAITTKLQVQSVAQLTRLVLEVGLPTTDDDPR